MTGITTTSHAVAVANKAKKTRFVDPDLLARAKVLEAKKFKLAEKRGSWKDATRGQRVKARAIRAEIAELKGTIQAEQAAGLAAHQAYELEKQAAARVRELAQTERGV